MNDTDDLRFAKSHEWLRQEGDTATVGISDHAQHELSDVVYVELPESGREVEAGEAVCVVESVKAASDIYAPAAGTITKVNEALIKDPALINTAPFAGGWIFQMQVRAEGPLLSPEEYRAQIGA